MSTNRRGKTESSKTNWFKTHRKMSIVIGILIALVLLFSIFMYKVWVQPTAVAREPLSILILGQDISDYRDDHWMGTKPSKSDAIMVVTFNPNTYKFVATSIPRDTAIDYLCYPNHREKANELYYVSGGDMDCVVDSFSNFLNVPIDYYLVVDMDQAIDIIDLVGGVTITAYAADGYLSQENVDNTQTYYWVHGEEYHMDGDEALTYMRARGDSEKDYGRGKRQQQVIFATGKAILDHGISKELIEAIYDLVETDVPAKLAYEYYLYISEIYEFMDAILNGGDVYEDMLPASVWENMFDELGYSYTKINDQTVQEFADEVHESPEKQEEVTSYFFTSYQFYNETYSGYYNVVDEQLQEISNALRINLELDEEYAELPSLPYGDNYALGLMPEETTKSKQSSSSESSSESNSSSSQSEEKEEVIEEPVEEAPPESLAVSSYATNVTQTSADIIVEVDLQNANLSYGVVTLSTGQTFELTNGYNQFTVTGLEPNNTYTYTVEVVGETSSFLETYVFTTLEDQPESRLGRIFNSLSNRRIKFLQR